LSAQLGRSKSNFRLWQDQKSIAPGKLWEAEIRKAVEEAVFFLPIVTPRAVKSPHCRFEFESFLARERGLKRDDLIFPILYISVPALDDEGIWRDDPVLSVIGKRQYVDWRPFRHLATDWPAAALSIERLCSKIVQTLRDTSPKDRPRHEETATQRSVGSIGQPSRAAAFATTNESAVPVGRDTVQRVKTAAEQAQQRVNATSVVAKSIDWMKRHPIWTAIILVICALISISTNNSPRH
jgi:hypothetical protein